MSRNNNRLTALERSAVIEVLNECLAGAVEDTFGEDSKHTRRLFAAVETAKAKLIRQREAERKPAKKKPAAPKMDGLKSMFNFRG